MGKLKRTDSGIIVGSDVDTGPAKEPTHWASWANNEGGELFNGTQAQALGVLAGFVQRHGMTKGFQCGMGMREDVEKKETVN